MLTEVRSEVNLYTQARNQWMRFKIESDRVIESDRGTELNCRHQPFQDVIVLYKELKLLVIFHCGGRGQPNGQPATSN